MRKHVFEFVSAEAEWKFLKDVFGPKPKTEHSKAKDAMLAVRKVSNSKNQKDSE